MLGARWGRCVLAATVESGKATLAGDAPFVPPRVAAFRAAYRAEEIPKGYKPWLHVAITFGGASAAFIACLFMLRDVQPLARREGFASVPELIGAARIRADGALWNAIADNLAQSDTRFFRDRSQFEKLRTTLLPEALKRRAHERVRIWSAGCATGQEAYSIAILLRERMASQYEIPHIQIFATDLDGRALAAARAMRSA